MNPISLYEIVFSEILHEVHIWELVRDDRGKIITWRLLNANPSALKNWGKTLAEVKGKTTGEIFPGVDAAAAFMPIVEKIFRERKPHSWEVYFEGTGYSSLTSLKKLPIDELKIDRSFTKDILLDPTSSAIAESVIVLAKSMGLEVIAEGVEEEAQRIALKALGCIAYQGHLYGKALPRPEFMNLIAVLQSQEHPGHDARN